MTNERAIELLHRISDSQFDGEYGDERREALEMAVRALVDQNLGEKTIDCIIERLDGEDTAQPTQTNADSTHENTLDCVSRQAAMVVFENSGLDDDSKDTVVRVLEQLPSAQPHWIPCSERLPEEDEDVLVCSEDGDIDIACWMPEQWTDEPHIEWWSGEYRVFAIAWLPLPKPYRGESDV